ncbi:MAG: hypothetical protein AAB278_04780, partial [Pseudomonadota bacterium]
VHYSDTIPPDINKTQTVQSTSGKGSSSTSGFSAKSVAEREADLKKANKEKETADNKKAQENAQAELKKQNCDALRDNLRTLQESTRIVAYDEKGEKIYLDDAAREQRLNDARNELSTNCN